MNTISKLSNNHIFISYGRADGTDFAQKIYNDLEADGIIAWLDIRNIRDGFDWDSEIDKGLRNAKALIVLITPGSNVSIQVKSEWNYALNEFIPVIPLLVIGRDVPRVLSMINYIDFRSNYSSGIAKLRRRLDTLTKDHSEYLHNLISEYKNAKKTSINPERFDGKIKNLQNAIKKWEKPNAINKEKNSKIIQYEIDKEKTKALELSKQRAHQVASKVVGQRLSDAKSYFKNRDDEQKRLYELLIDPNTKLVSLIGRGGIGKSLLASKVLKKLEEVSLEKNEAHKEVDGIIYQSTRTNGISLEKIFSDFSLLLRGENAKAINSIWTNDNLAISQKIDNLFDLLMGKFYILLLDNLEDLIDQKRKLKDSDLFIFLSKCINTENNIKVLITSRVPINFPNEFLRFDQKIVLEKGLPVIDGVAMLRDLDPSGTLGLKDCDENTLIQTTEHVGGIPRALEVIAGILADDPFESIKELISDNKLFNSPKLVETIIKESYRRLDKNSKIVVEGLAIYKRPVPIVALEYLLEPYIIPSKVKEIAKYLSQRFILGIDRETKYLSLHPLDRDFIYQIIPEDEIYNRGILESRAAEYYEKVTLEKDHWKSLEDIQPKIYQFEHLCNAEKYIEATNLIEEIDQNYLEAWGYNRKIVEMREKTLENLGNTKHSAINLGMLARAYHRLAQYRTAIDLNLRALEISNKINDDNGASTWLYYIGINELYLGKIQDAKNHFIDALSLAKISNNKRRVSACINALGITSLKLGKIYEALEYFSESLSIRRELNNRRWESDSLQNIGEAYRLLAKPKFALEHFELRNAATDLPGSWTGKLEILVHSSHVYIEIGQFEIAKQNLEEALLHIREMGEWRWEGLVLGLFGKLNMYQGNFINAIDYLSSSIKISKDISALENQAHFESLLGESFSAIGDHNTALNHILNAYLLAESLDVSPLRIHCGIILGYYYCQTNNIRNAKKIINQIPPNKIDSLEPNRLLLEAIQFYLTNKIELSKKKFNETMQICLQLLEGDSPQLEIRLSKLLAMIGSLIVENREINNQLDEEINILLITFPYAKIKIKKFLKTILMASNNGDTNKNIERILRFVN